MTARRTACLFAALLALAGCDAVPPDATIRIRSYEYFVFLPNDYESQEDKIFVTWSTSIVGVASYDQLELISETALNLIEDFIEDFQRVNL